MHDKPYIYTVPYCPQEAEAVDRVIDLLEYIMKHGPYDKLMDATLQGLYDLQNAIDWQSKNGLL